MAKSARASTKKSNNSKLKRRVFAPVETARTERLSAKLLALATQPRPTEKDSEDTAMEIERVPEDNSSPAKEGKEAEDMGVDAAVAKSSSKQTTGKGRIHKKKSSRSKASIVFPKYKSKARR